MALKHKINKQYERFQIKIHFKALYNKNER